MAHAALPLSQAQVRELLVSSGSAYGLFNQSLLERISSQVKEDSFSSPPLSPWLRWPSLVSMAGISPLPHFLVLRAPLLRLVIRATSLLCFNVPPLISALPLLAEVAVQIALRGAGVRLLLQNPVGVFESRSRIPVLP